MMSKIVLVLFLGLTVGSIWMTYRGAGLQSIVTHSTIKKEKYIRHTHIGSWSSSEGGGYSSGK